MDTKDRVAVLTINRPDKRNALNHEVRSDLYQMLKEVDVREEIRAAVITGAGEAFVAGADIAAMKDYGQEDAMKASREGSDIFLFIENMKIPFIAAINGWALGGGCELALACDIRVCAVTAMLGQPEVTVGIIPGYGANVRLARLVGPGKAKELIFTGKLIDAVEAERIGLVNAVVSEKDLMGYAVSLARELANASAAVSFAKKAINRAFDMTTEEAMEFSSRLYGEVYRTSDAKEGINAYLEKRKPAFIGK